MFCTPASCCPETSANSNHFLAHFKYVYPTARWIHIPNSPCLKLKASLFPQVPKLLLSLILLSLKGTLIYTYHGILIACKPVFSTNSKILEDKECYLIRVSTPSLTQYLPNPINVNLKIDHWDFHGGLECKTSHFQCRGHVFVPGHGTNIPHAGWGGQKQNKHQQQNSKN